MIAGDGGPDEGELELIRSICSVSRETIARLDTYRQLLNQWQKRTNLIAPSTLGEFWSRHVADSLQAFAIRPQARIWTDLGSGGGFPGMVIAIILAERNPNGHVNLVESNGKKCAFLRQVARQTGARAVVHQTRIELATKQIMEAEIITARALAPLIDLLGYTEHSLQGNRVGLFHKGRENLREIELCRGSWAFDLVVHSSSLDPESVILEIANARRIESPATG